MNIYAYICMYICIYMHTYIYIYIHACVHICMYAWYVYRTVSLQSMFLCVWLYTYINWNGGIHVGVNLYIYIFMLFLCVWVYLGVYISVCDICIDIHALEARCWPETSLFNCPCVLLTCLGLSEAMPSAAGNNVRLRVMRVHIPTHAYIACVHTHMRSIKYIHACMHACFQKVQIYQTYNHIHKVCKTKPMRIYIAQIEILIYIYIQNTEICISLHLHMNMRHVRAQAHSDVLASLWSFVFVCFKMYMCLLDTVCMFARNIIHVCENDTYALLTYVWHEHASEGAHRHALHTRACVRQPPRHPHSVCVPEQEFLRQPDHGAACWRVPGPHVTSSAVSSVMWLTACYACGTCLWWRAVCVLQAE